MTYAVGMKGLNTMRISRRDFLGGAAALWATHGLPALAAAKTQLTVGVVSDIHVADTKGYDLPAFVRALRFFRERGVEAVVCAGDMADWGRYEQLELVRDAWRQVFPDDRGTDGRKVERFFIYGNHDVASWGGKAGPDGIYHDPGAAWKRCWGEDWAPVYMKRIGGYAFIGAHWGHETELPAFLAAHADELHSSDPFFCVQHPHPCNTCHGPDVWGHDAGKTTAALSRFPNAVALSGHSHWPLTDEQALWQGSFTSVGLSSLSYTSLPKERRGPNGFENTNMVSLDGDKAMEGGKMMPLAPQNGQNGLVMTVCPGRIVFERWDFAEGRPERLGDDWVVTCPVGKEASASFAARAAREVPPAFTAGAVLKVSRVRAKTRGYRGFNGMVIPDPVLPSEKEAFEFAVPQATANRTRAFELEVIIEGSAGEIGRRYVLVEGHNRAQGNAQARRPTVVRLACDQFPANKVRFRVIPVSALGNRGRPLVSDWIRG